jgi:hypothetical protein
MPPLADCHATLETQQLPNALRRASPIHLTASERGIYHEQCSLTLTARLFYKLLTQAHTGYQRQVDTIYRLGISISQNFDHSFPRYKIINLGVYRDVSSSGAIHRVVASNMN